ncbi:hypothetical protein JRC04_05175 [Mycolicibacterium sp. S2-37]|uniref:hypothetical protein n=1 Tax=Mycolicibacterium sp. S2-37 TaxID=2810297 RepID=UPI001A94660D|nr:hypothetical protein [Mycolicibacterium sp. S2-37]MBO0676849.1 hypothetical protein [Mycolicibacterium sp. S2-37]
MSEFMLPYACKPVYVGSGSLPYYSVHVEDHVFHLHPSDVTDAKLEQFAASLAARYRLAEHLATLKGNNNS